MATEQKEIPGGDEGLDQPFIPGTAYKTAEEAAKGITELNSLLGKQGNEMGTLRKQVETLSEVLKTVTAQKQEKAEPKEAAPDYDNQVEAINNQIMGLDPLADGYQKDLAVLITKSQKLAAMGQHDKTLNAASDIFKKELDERDIKQTHKEFFSKNPDFNTPEMQARIKEKMASDTTGMSDPLAAYREIQRDDIAAEVQQIKAERDELAKRLDLMEGKNQTGPVITKAQVPGRQQTSKPQKATGADLDAGMRAALEAAVQQGG